MENKDEQVYDLQPWQGNLPEIHIPQGQLARPLARMEYVALLSRWAMNVGSDAHVYAVMKLIMSGQQAELLKQTWQDIPPEVEASYRKLTEQYISQMEAIPRQVSDSLLTELERIPADLGNQSLLSKLRAFFSE